MIQLDSLIKKVEDLPPLPDIVVKLLHASRDPNVSTREMVELIKHDPALTIKVLRLCNSSYYGLPRKINSIQEALVYIGTDTLVNFVLAGCLSTFYQQAQTGYGLEKGELWRHSVGCAIAAQRIAAWHDDEGAAQAFTAGLIHDIGKILINVYVGEEIDTILKMVEDEQIAFCDAEKKILGFSQTEAGAKLARHWNLPEPLIEAIEFHQAPEKAKIAPRLVSQVHLANILCISFGIGVGADGLAYTFHPKALEETGVEVSDLFQLSLDIHDDYKKAEELITLAA
jgi:HD-like signal output (HDOD) protein